MKSCLYEGIVMHSRFRPKVHFFKYKLFLVYLDLDEVDEFFSLSRFWSYMKGNIAYFKRSDYHGDKTKNLKSEVLKTVEMHLGRNIEGSVRMLTSLRYFGHCFNPVTFYYCFNKECEIEAIMAEIENTPWGERFCYVVDATKASHDKEIRKKFKKEFHVSPFFPMSLMYDWRFSNPHDLLKINMETFEKGEKVFLASMNLKKVVATEGALNKILIKFPLITLKVVLGIYFQAFLLWIKGVPFFDHPNPASRRELFSHTNIKEK
ncbi:PF07103 family protein [Bacteriovorax sp. BAL6_X]|uniref:DUF1365 domain-containing protein n=1 Tax=Bacteriovorax sp. BAL6_X TaxID=1201290 RepID=UPI0003862680|nr:DUF1365 domain-containing protein [Bacteriovorax sp. BAL6_X]EPZ49535.1 PF07103 family protein [Bacteriovorax sp. BAL6_X]